MKKYFFEIQMDFFPGCGWLRSPHGRDSWQQAWDEGQQYVEFGFKYRGFQLALHIVEVEIVTPNVGN